MITSYGWIPDIPDGRDYLYKSIRPKVRLPKEANLTKFCSKVEDQGRLGSCTAQSLTGNIEFLDNRLDSVYADVSASLASPTAIPLSSASPSTKACIPSAS